MPHEPILKRKWLTPREVKECVQSCPDGSSWFQDLTPSSPHSKSTVWSLCYTASLMKNKADASPRKPAGGRFKWTVGPLSSGLAPGGPEEGEFSVTWSTTRACTGPESESKIFIQVGWSQTRSGNIEEGTHQKYILKARERHCPGLSHKPTLFCRLKTRLTDFCAKKINSLQERLRDILSYLPCVIPNSW